MKWPFIISVVLFSCISGSLSIEHTESINNELSSTNYIKRDLQQPISDSLVIPFDRSVNDKPVIFDNKMLVSTSSGHSFIYSKDPEYNDIYESSVMRLNQGSEVGPIIYKNFILFALGSGKDNLQLYDLKTSSFVWKLRVPFDNDSRPLIFDDYIYLATLNGLIIQLFFGNGAEQWRYNTRNHISADINVNNELIYSITHESE